MSPFSSRGFSAETLFVWLFALAVSMRVFYPELVQLIFFALLFAYAWSAPPLRANVLSYPRQFFASNEGKVALLLLVSITISTILASSRDGMFLWFNWLQLLVFSFALFGCTAFLGLHADALRRAFRLVGLCLLCAMFLWVCVLVAARMNGGFSFPFLAPYLAPYFVNASLHWSYSQAGLTVLFFPLLFAAFGGKNPSVSEKIQPTVWRCCIGLASLLFLLAATISERRVIGAALIASSLVLILSMGLKSRFHLWLPILVLGSSLLVSALLFYLYNNPVIYGKTSSLCESCNSLYLPLWLVDDARQAAWHEALVVWRENPWWGRGIHNDLTSFFHPHNRFLQVLSGLGIVGFALFLTLLGLVFVKACVAWYRTGTLSSLSLMFVHGVYWSTGLFELSIWSVWHFAMYACAIVMSLSLDRLPESRQRIPAERSA